METAVEVVLQILLFLAVGWVVVCGGIGALIAHRRRGWWLSGALWGIALGPIGWCIVLYRTRGSARAFSWPGRARPQIDEGPSDFRSDLEL